MTSPLQLVLEVDLQHGYRSQSFNTSQEMLFHLFQISYCDFSVLWDIDLRVPLDVKIPPETPVCIKIRGECNEILLPRNIAENIVKILTIPTDFVGMDSKLFVSGLLICEWMGKKECRFKSSDIPEFVMDAFTPLSIVEDDCVCHSAIYLGRGLYIDKIGAFPMPSIRNREELMHAFPRGKIVPMTSTIECDHCKRKETPDHVMKWCKSCHVVMYCNRECQKAHWKIHKNDCAVLGPEGKRERKKYIMQQTLLWELARRTGASFPNEQVFNNAFEIMRNEETRKMFVESQKKKGRAEGIELLTDIFDLK
jgi:hypothetical protein